VWQKWIYLLATPPCGAGLDGGAITLGTTAALPVRNIDMSAARP
jgi:hypothetical protein